MIEDVPDPRVTEDICGHTVTGGTGLTWVCIKAPHLEAYQRRGKRHPEPSTAPAGDRHYFVNRWPNRPVPPLES